VTETCLLGGRYREMLENPAFQGASSRLVTEPGQLVGIEADQAVLAVQEAFDDVTNLTEALAAVQEGEINVTGLYHPATGTQLLAFEFGAGDNSYGAVFYAGALAMAAAINDGDFYGCNLFAARGGAQIGEDCRGRDDCGEQLTCQGVFAGTGRCVPTENPPGEGASCDSDTACGHSDLICDGASSGFGTCRPRWLRGDFSDIASAAIPDGGSLSRRLAVYGLATVDTSVWLRLTIAHPHPGQLRITLTNPATTEALFFDGTPDDEGDIYLEVEGPVSGFSGDEQVNGEWTLRVEDRVAGGSEDSGRLVRWDLTVTSRWD
jgi:hypothetical protein